FNEAVIIQRLKIGLTQQVASVFDVFLALDLFDTDIEQADTRAFDAKDCSCHGSAQYRKIDKLTRVGANSCADIKNKAFSTGGRPDGYKSRTLDARHHTQAELGHRHQRTGISC